MTANPPSPGSMTGAPPPEPVVKTSALAIWSLVSALIGIITCGLGGVVAICLGALAIVNIRQSDGRMGGMGLAVIGLVLGVAMIGLWFVLGGKVILPGIERMRIESMINQDRQQLTQINYSLQGDPFGMTGTTNTNAAYPDTQEKLVQLIDNGAWGMPLQSPYTSPDEPDVTPGGLPIPGQDDPSGSDMLMAYKGYWFVCKGMNRGMDAGLAVAMTQIVDPSMQPVRNVLYISGAVDSVAHEDFPQFIADQNKLRTAEKLPLFSVDMFSDQPEAP